MNGIIYTILHSVSQETEYNIFLESLRREK